MRERYVRGVGVCIATGSTIPSDYIKSEGVAGRMGSALVAIVAEGLRGRVYCDPTDLRTDSEIHSPATFLPSGRMSDHPQYMGTPRYGLDEWWKLVHTKATLYAEHFL